MNSRDNVFVQAAISYGYLKQEQVEECAKLQQKYRKEGKEVPLEEVLLEKGFLSSQQINNVYEEMSKNISQATVDTVLSKNPEQAPANKPNKQDKFPKLMAKGAQIDRYEITEVLGRGGMGAVYKAKDTLLQRDVAIKILLGSDNMQEEQVQRFFIEAQASAKLSHPNIVGVHDMGELDNKSFYLVMECVSGKSLDKIIKERAPLEAGEAIDITRQVAQALGAAHKFGIIHRDIKPANIIMTEDGIAKVADFGLAKIATAAGASLSKSGQLLGTPYYMSPEQVAGKDVSKVSDFYSLGITLYQMLSGKLPYRGDTLYSLLMAHIDKEPTPLQQHNPAIPLPLIQTVERMMAKKKEDRFQTAEDLIVALNQVTLGDSNFTQTSSQKVDLPAQPSAPSAQTEVPPPPPPSVPKKKRGLLKSFSLLIMVAIVLVPLVLWQFFPKKWQMATAKGKEFWQQSKVMAQQWLQSQSNSPNNKQQQHTKNGQNNDSPPKKEEVKEEEVKEEEQVLKEKEQEKNQQNDKQTPVPQVASYQFLLQDKQLSVPYQFYNEQGETIAESSYQLQELSGKKQIKVNISLPPKQQQLLIRQAFFYQQIPVEELSPNTKVELNQIDSQKLQSTLDKLPARRKILVLWKLIKSSPYKERLFSSSSIADLKKVLQTVRQTPASGKASMFRSAIINEIRSQLRQKAASASKQKYTITLEKKGLERFPLTIYLNGSPLPERKVQQRETEDKIVLQIDLSSQKVEQSRLKIERSFIFHELSLSSSVESVSLDQINGQKLIEQMQSLDSEKVIKTMWTLIHNNTYQNALRKLPKEQLQQLVNLLDKLQVGGENRMYQSAIINELKFFVTSSN